MPLLKSSNYVQARAAIHTRETLKSNSPNPPHVHDSGPQTARGPQLNISDKWHFVDKDMERKTASHLLDKKQAEEVSVDGWNKRDPRYRAEFERMKRNEKKRHDEPAVVNDDQYFKY